MTNDPQTNAAIDFDGVKVLAVDLMGTLVRKADDGFVTAGSQYLSQHGYEISAARFRTLYRRRYLEYSMGNYAGDPEFYSVLSADLTGDSPPPWLDALTDIRIECSPPLEGAQAFLEQMSRTYRLILSSNHVLGWARRILLQNHWEHYFSELLISSECRFRKPSPQFFLELSRASGLPPAQILVIGDSLTDDVYGAARAGFPAVHVNRNSENQKRELSGTAFSVLSLDELSHRLTSRQLIPG